MYQIIHRVQIIHRCMVELCKYFIYRVLINQAERAFVDNQTFCSVHNNIQKPIFVSSFVATCVRPGLYFYMDSVSIAAFLAIQINCAHPSLKPWRHHGTAFFMRGSSIGMVPVSLLLQSMQRTSRKAAVFCCHHKDREFKTEAGLRTSQGGQHSYGGSVDGVQTHHRHLANGPSHTVSF